MSNNDLYCSVCKSNHHPVDCSMNNKIITKVLITGACGFIGHHIVEAILKQTNWHIYIIDKLTRESFGFDRLRDIEVYDSNRITLFATDFTKVISHGIQQEVADTNYVLHLGAETHVDRSIDNPKPFIMANVVGTMNILNLARTFKQLSKFLYFSTDEVFGPAAQGQAFREWDRYNSGNPYAASKAGGEELALAYHNSYGLPVVITHTMNVFGERQHYEKFIPQVIRRVLLGDQVFIHSNKEKTKAGSRFYIHARNVADAILYLLPKAKLGDKYNIVGEREVDNLEMARFIADILNKPLKHQMVSWHHERPGHDLRYALCGWKMEDMGWKIPKTFENSLIKTIKWYIKYKNKRWLGI